MKSVDYILVGLGLAGATLALQLREKGKSVMVFDQPFANQASRVAAGLFNPITGKLLSKTWNADKLFPYLHDFYHKAEQTLNTRFFHPASICIPFKSIEEQNNFAAHAGEEPFIKEVYTGKRHPDFIFDPMGGMVLNSSGYVDTITFLNATKELLVREDSYAESLFNYDELVITPGRVAYNDYEAKAIIFCEGTASLSNPFFKWAPVRQLKGETIEIRLRRETPCIFNRGVYMVPIGPSPDFPGMFLYKVGATYNHNVTPGVTLAAKNELEAALRELLRSNFRIGNQNWGIRPTSPDRRPMLGTHPDHENVLIFNGLGTKGVSLAPYFSRVLSDHILGVRQIDREVNISRFYALYSKFRD